MFGGNPRILFSSFVKCPLYQGQLGESLPPTTLVLLPGLDGTGNLFVKVCFSSAGKSKCQNRPVSHRPSSRLCRPPPHRCGCDPKIATLRSSGRIFLNSAGRTVSRNKPGRLERVGYLCWLHQKSCAWLVALHEKPCPTFVVPNSPASLRNGAFSDWSAGTLRTPG